MKLFTIGDSVSQGFMSLAAARTDNAYSTLIARKLGLELDSDEYRFADWNDVGIPLKCTKTLLINGTTARRRINFRTI